MQKKKKEKKEKKISIFTQLDLETYSKLLEFAKKENRTKGNAIAFIVKQFLIIN